MNEIEAKDAVIEAAKKVHSVLGGGYLESVYEAAMAIEFRKNKVPYFVEYNVEVFYEDECVGTQRLDFVVGDKIAVELKSKESITKLNEMQTRAYLRTMNFARAVIVNFLKDELEYKVIKPGSDTVPLKVAEAGAKKTDGPGVSGAGR